MVQGAKHMKSNNAAANGGSSPQPKPQPKSKRRRKRLPRWADRLITIVIILIGVGLMTWPWILDRLEASGVFNQISTVSSTVDALSAEERERILLQARSFNEQLAGEATELPAEMEITPAIIEDLKAKARAASDASRDVAAVVPVRFTVDNKTQANPVGTFGQSVGARMAVLTCAPQIKRMLRRVIEERLGMKIQDYIVRPLAEAALVLTDDERRLGCMFVDFGAETTTVAIFKNDAPAYLVTLPMGSRNITIDLTSLNYIEERAEEIKRISGNAMPAEGVAKLVQFMEDFVKQYG